MTAFFKIQKRKTCGFTVAQVSIKFPGRLSGSLMVSSLHSESPIRFSRKDYVDVELRIPAVQKARDLLGFEAQIDLDEGIRRTANFYREVLK